MEQLSVLETERLLLRTFRPTDAEALYLLLKEEEVTRFLPMFSLKTMEEAENRLNQFFLEQGCGSFGLCYAICPKPDGPPIGYIKVSGEESHDLGYALRKEFWHRGIATEAGKAVTKRLADLGIPYITATHDIKNPRSGEVMKKLGMTYRYTYEEQWQPKNIPVLFRLYQLNFDGQSERVFRTYWDRSSVRFFEKEV